MRLISRVAVGVLVIVASTLFSCTTTTTLPINYPYRACLVGSDKESANGHLLSEKVEVVGEDEYDHLLILYVERNESYFRKPFPIDRERITLVCRAENLFNR